MTSTGDATGPETTSAGPETASAGPGSSATAADSTGTSTTTGPGTSEASADVSGSFIVDPSDDGGFILDPSGDPGVCVTIEREPGCEGPGTAPAGPFEVTEIALPNSIPMNDACPCFDSERSPDFEIYAPDDWPSSPTSAPLAILAHGNGLHPDSLANVIEILGSMGFVVINVDLGQDGDREEDATCALEAMWAAFGTSLDCDVVLVGHSAGARDMLDLSASSFQDPAFSILRPFEIRGYVLLAPGFGSGGETTFPNLPEVPALIFGTTTDEQVPGVAGQIFDGIALEGSDASYGAERVTFWVDGTNHVQFAGAGARALPAMQGYIPEFVRAKVFAGVDDLWWSYATNDAWPPEVLDDELWSGLEPYGVHADVDCSAIVSDCEGTRGCAATPSDACIDEPRIKSMVAPPTQYRHPVQAFETLDPGDIDSPTGMSVDVDDAATVTSGLAGARGVESRILRVDYGDPAPVGDLRFPLAESNVGDMTHLTLRAGNVLELDGGCAAVSDLPVRFDVHLSRGGLEASVPVSTGRLPQQYRSGTVGPVCPSVQALQTVRFNLGEWCEFGTDEVDEIVLTFAEPVEPARVLIDTIEFTDVPEDSVDDLPVCGESGVAAMWACEIDDLTITETSCATEPTGTPATCATVGLRTNPVDPPEVELPGDTFDGWLVHTRPGMVYDIFDPTTDEVELVRSRCIEACELEYAGRSGIAVECSAANGFFTPTLVGDDSHAAAFQIPRSMIHGEFEPTDEMLDCDLRVDCCEAFDEGLCPARPWRPTEARAPLGRGEEWHYTTTGVIVIDSEAMDEPVMGDLQGTLGGSLCEGGNATETCPIYLGSATVELLEPLEVELDCGGTPVIHTLDELTLSLAQPAFGMHLHEEPDWSFFTPGSLVFDAHTVVDDIPIDTFLPNEDGVTMKFNAGWAQVPLFSHFELVIDVPCGEQTVPVSAWFGFVDDEVVGSPPYGVSITVPSTLSCPQTRGLTGTASDGQSDIAGVRWKVDDVLLAPGTTSMAFTQDHDLTAIVRDSRGATTTVHKHVDCI